ncbi:ribulose-phosphate 3-epimerase [Scopulibacillus darangshiensis]|uniref:Ribulose-phosphate 3-epimerase n=1 Tax=Scopulibacillus darangshiensis TaxID=442528 RepID=A0A4R2P4X7_9BACL|nr:ribulose-phosphate 3-epimerase [Scopulibacillus darangshiensis]TCP29134.1 ribulose-phosphate 3-epimerase [Scopulibacillus darangshiensis]
MRIAPSILAADFANLESEIKDVEASDIDLLHIDVMDGHFVPNITMGSNVVGALRPLTDCELDVHLMIENPDQYISDFADAGADMISVHVETCPHLHRTIQLIKEKNIKAGVALNPATPIEIIEPIIQDLDFILIMTVNPGFGGQVFIESMLGKIRKAKSLIDERGLEIAIEVDGGINEDTLGLCRKAGAELFVAGSSIFGQSNRSIAIDKLRGV